ncbi:MAG: hypothetical protein JSS14_22985 [Proteobacteria bacterium]|nr:hypothetical protein [Pseudomonadota bacterium]
MADSVITVDSLIKTENRLALARAREQSISAGLSQPDVPKASAAPAAAVLVVNSIYGLEGNLRANLMFNGAIYERVSVGARLDSCSIASIKGKSVALKPAHKGASAKDCPTGHWLGVTQTPLGGIQPAMAQPASRGAMPSPAVPTPFTSVGAPSAAAMQSLRQPPALKVSQPTIQLVPSGPVAPGQTAIPLVARQLEPEQAPAH